jgi:hypothetical protein
MSRYAKREMEVTPHSRRPQAGGYRRGDTRFQLKSVCHEAKLPLSSAPYAESDRPQQNPEVSLEAV